MMLQAIDAGIDYTLIGYLYENDIIMRMCEKIHVRISHTEKIRIIVIKRPGFT